LRVNIDGLFLAFRCKLLLGKILGDNMDYQVRNVMHWSSFYFLKSYFRECLSSKLLFLDSHKTLNIDIAIPSRYKSDGISQFTACITTSRLRSNSATSNSW
jgi:hypothetical protein